MSGCIIIIIINQFHIHSTDKGHDRTAYQIPDRVQVSTVPPRDVDKTLWGGVYN